MGGSSGLSLLIDSFKVLILNVYLPCEYRNVESLIGYRTSIARLDNTIAMRNFDENLIVGYISWARFCYWFRRFTVWKVKMYGETFYNHILLYFGFLMTHDLFNENLLEGSNNESDMSEFVNWDNPSDADRKLTLIR